MRMAGMSLGIQITLTAYIAVVLAALLRANPWRHNARLRLRNPVAIAAWIAYILTLVSISTAVWSEPAANWFGGILTSIAHRLVG